MTQFEYFPVLIDAHRNDLRAIAHPLPAGVVTPSWRKSLGLRLVRFGQWLEGNRPTLSGEPLPRLGETTGTT